MKIAIFGQYYQNDTRPIIKDIFLFLKKNHVELVIEAAFLKILCNEQILKKEYATFETHSDLDISFDLMISIGGDGTILRAATFVRGSGIPILGINAGRLGFLAKVQKDNIEEFLQLVLDQKYTISERTLLQLECEPNNPSIGTLNFALNEVSVSRKFKWRIPYFLLGRWFNYRNTHRFYRLFIKLWRTCANSRRSKLGCHSNCTA
jgi:NAD+ kinase